MVNSLASETVVWLAKALEDNIYYPSLQKYIAGILPVRRLQMRFAITKTYMIVKVKKNIIRKVVK